MKHITKKEILKAYKTLEKADHCGFCESKDYDFLYLMVKMCKKCQMQNKEWIREYNKKYYQSKHPI